MSKDIQIIELDNEDIEVQIDSCVITWSELLGNPAGNQALITLLTGLLEEKLDKKVAPIVPNTHTKITYDANGLVVSGGNLSVEDLPLLHLSNISDVSATASEVNKLHNLQATKNELDTLHGITSTTSELNILHGLQASTVELNKLKGLLISCAQMNMLVGIRGNIQDQLDSKMDNVDYVIERQENKTNDYSSNSIVTYPSSKALKDGLETKQDILSAEQLDKLNNATTISDVTALLNGKIDKNNPIQANTATKVTYDEKGLITGKGSLIESDIPSIHLSKITDVNVSASELNQLDGLTVGSGQINQLSGISSNIQNQINTISGKIPSDATTENKLADKEYVRKWVKEHAGYFLAKDANNSCFESKAELNSTTNFYHNGEIKVPSEDDYVIIKKDETKNNIVAVYSWKSDSIVYYQGHWQFMYKVANSWDITSYDKSEINSMLSTYTPKASYEADKAVINEELNHVNSRIDSGHVAVRSYNDGNLVLDVLFNN